VGIGVDEVHEMISGGYIQDYSHGFVVVVDLGVESGLEGWDGRGLIFNAFFK
jgi:hypothetical protein